jgi:hypothetical protein
MVSVFAVAVSDETDAEPSLTIDFHSSYRATSRKLALIILGANLVISIFNWIMVSCLKREARYGVFIQIHKRSGVALLQSLELLLARRLDGGCEAYHQSRSNSWCHF